MAKYGKSDPVKIKREIGERAKELAAINAKIEEARTELGRVAKSLAGEKQARLREQDSHLAVIAELLSFKDRLLKETADLQQRVGEQRSQVERGGVLLREIKKDLASEARVVAKMPPLILDLLNRSRQELHSANTQRESVVAELQVTAEDKGRLTRELASLQAQKQQLVSEIGRLNDGLHQKNELLAKWTEMERRILWREQTSKAMLRRLDEKWLKHYKDIPHKPDTE